MISFITSCDSSSKVDISYDPDLCGLHDYRTGDNMQIMNSACAEEQRVNYVNNIEAIKDSLPNYPNLDKFLIKGARLTLDELFRIYSTAKYNNDEFVYVMLAADSTDTASMLFAFKNETDIHPAPLTYYNFTRPCPHACPD